MFEKLNYIELSGKAYPIKCDILVLEKIQDKYGDFSDFEDKLIGFTPLLDEEGEQVRNEEGLRMGTFATPDIEVLKDALFWMMEEGAEIKKDSGEDAEPLEEKKILRGIDIPLSEVKDILHDEFSRCFYRKNGKATQRENPEKGNK